MVPPSVTRLLFSLPLLAFAACDTTDPPPPSEPLLKLELLNVSCQESWLEVSLQASVQPRNIVLRRFSTTEGGDTITVLATAITSTDTLIVDDHLLPSRTYSYIVSCPATLFDHRYIASLRTLDTTSHDFEWETSTLGDAYSSVNDIAIINDTLAYAVGEMYLRDSTGQIDPLLYNLARWDGRQWEIKRVTVMFQGNPISVALDGIFARSASDIWLAGSIPIHGDGVSWTGYDIQALVGTGATVSHIWGTPSELYFVGRAGNIIYFNGTNWRRLQSGTITDIHDVWGAVNAATGRQEVYCVTSSFFTLGDRKILRIDDQQQVDTVSWGPQRDIYTVWTKTGDPLYVGGSVLHRRINATWQEIDYGSRIVPNHIRGTALNDILLVGDFGLISHFNGVGWRVIGSDFDALYGSIDLTGRLLIVVGEKNGRGIVSIARRN